MARTAKKEEATTVKTKTEETKVVKDTKENDSADLIKQLMAQLEEQNKAMAEMKAQLDSQKNQTVTVQQTESRLGAKRIPCINLLHCELNVSTKDNGKGRLFNFGKYGDVRHIPFDSLTECLASYPKTFENGYIYIADEEAVKALYLDSYYDEFPNADALKDVVKMNEEIHYTLFKGLGNKMKETYAREIAQRIVDNEDVDYNLVVRIKNECNIDIQKIVDEINDSKKTK